MARKQTTKPEPMAGVSDATIYAVMREVGPSWFEKCAALERELVAIGWTPPKGHPLAKIVP